MIDGIPVTGPSIFTKRTLLVPCFPIPFRGGYLGPLQRGHSLQRTTSQEEPGLQSRGQSGYHDAMIRTWWGYDGDVIFRWYWQNWLIFIFYVVCQCICVYRRYICIMYVYVCLYIYIHMENNGWSFLETTIEFLKNKATIINLRPKNPGLASVNHNHVHMSNR